MHEWLASLGLTGWKPLLTTWLLPPLPWMVMVLWGAWCLARHRRSGWVWTLAACVGLWASSSVRVGRWIEDTLLHPPAVLSEGQQQGLQQEAREQPQAQAIVVLGGGREPWAPEYAGPTLNRWSLERLRYGLWLSRKTGIPVAFSGGVGHAGAAGSSEAEVAAHVAKEDFHHPLRWLEAESRDTRENAQRSVALLRQAGVRHLVVVTHHWHMPRSMRAFEQAVASSGGGLALTAAPMGAGSDDDTWVAQWLPSTEGMARVRHALREWWGWQAGA